MSSERHSPDVDDARIGRTARVLRHRLGWTQRELAARAGVSQPMISLVERGRVERLSLPTLRKIVRALDADLVLFVRWRGGDLDRLLDARHARLAETATRLLQAAGWEVAPEVSFSVYGERGSIDLLAWHPGTRTLLVIELKSEVTSIEETLRRHDTKVRLAGRIGLERFGWRAAGVARLLVVEEGRTARRHVEQHRGLFARIYPNRNVAVRAWLRSPGPVPDGTFGGLLFLSSSDQASDRRRTGGRARVRHARTTGARRLGTA